MGQGERADDAGVVTESRRAEVVLERRQGPVVAGEALESLQMTANLNLAF